MIRTVWLAIGCLIALAGLTALKVGTASLVQEAAAPSEQLGTVSTVSDTVLADVLPKGDRLDAADEDDTIKPVRPLAITTKVASAAASETASSESGWRRSYAKREAGASRHRKGKLHKTSRRHRAYHASRGDGKSKYALVRKQKKSRSRG
jgi:hypothetical protein